MEGPIPSGAQAMDIRVLRSIPTPVADSLLSKGCRNAGDLLERPEMLKEALNQHHAANAEQKAAAMISSCRREAHASSASWSSADDALSLLRQAQAVQPIVLPCQGLNRLLGSALRPGGHILEVCGLPGTGKTQFCLQLCAAAQIPSEFGLAAGIGRAAPEAIYIDTEGSFVPRRYLQVCQALLNERRSSPSGVQGSSVQQSPATLEAILRGLHVCRAYDATELYATVKQLGNFLKSHPRVRTIVVDSVAFSFRHEYMDNTSQRARVLVDIATTLRRYGADHNLVIVVTNHMTTRFDRGSREDGNGWLAPALGETWAHQPSTQLRLEKTSGTFAQGHWLPGGISRATLTKSVEQAAGISCAYCIGTAGLRDPLPGPETQLRQPIQGMPGPLAGQGGQAYP
eukprot:TRINITY_DN33701_c0_g1_i1.p1 TRINITY_DN33701_c0_g1~~TRINITY_DN33701_c0_g1_i1.p1  ORF type:complete len:400 (+),score=59.71 TRINITY_DN33701_c0_g1_i1:88-1287(+)